MRAILPAGVIVLIILCGGLFAESGAPVEPSTAPAATPPTAPPPPAAPADPVAALKQADHEILRGWLVEQKASCAVALIDELYGVGEFETTARVWCAQAIADCKRMTRADLVKYELKDDRVFCGIKRQQSSITPPLILWEAAGVEQREKMKPHLVRKSSSIDMSLDDAQTYTVRILWRDYREAELRERELDQLAALAMLAAAEVGELASPETMAEIRKDNRVTTGTIRERAIKCLPACIEAARRQGVVCATCQGGRYIQCEACGGLGRLRTDCTACAEARANDIVRKCSTCGGKGFVRCPETISCEKCRGRGYRRKYNGKTKSGGVRQSWNDIGAERRTCLSCKGTGKKKCPICNGTGKKKCLACGGDGIEKCSACEGKGYTETRCSVCRAKGKIRCAACQGRGRVAHDDPEGAELLRRQYVEEMKNNFNSAI